MPTSENGIAAITISGVRKERNQPTIRMKISTRHGGESRAEVTEHFNSDMPFAVPFDGGLVVGERLGGVVDLERRAGAAESLVSSARSALFIFRMA